MLHKSKHGPVSDICQYRAVAFGEVVVYSYLRERLDEECHDIGCSVEPKGEEETDANEKMFVNDDDATSLSPSTTEENKDIGKEQPVLQGIELASTIIECIVWLTGALSDF